MPGTEQFRRMLGTLKRAAAALRDAEIPFAVGGSLAGWARGGPESNHDVDFLVRPEDAERALEALVAVGMRPEHPPEGWLVKAYDGDVLVDVIFAPSGMPVSDELLARSEQQAVDAMPMRVLPADELFITRLLAMSEHHLNFEDLLAFARALREQVDWERVRRETAGSPYARAFLGLATDLDIIEA